MSGVLEYQRTVKVSFVQVLYLVVYILTITLYLNFGIVNQLRIFRLYWFLLVIYTLYSFSVAGIEVGIVSGSI